MPVLRDLVARFGFEVDEKGAKQLENKIGSMKRGIGGLGKMLGVSLGVAGAKAFWSLGQQATRAQFNLKRFAGTDFKPLRAEFTRIKSDLNAIKAGAGDVVTEMQFDVSAARFIKIFGRGKGQLEAFGKIFEFAAKQSSLTGVAVTDIVAQIQSGIQGGGFESLLELPGFDIFKKKLLEFQQQAIDPGEPGGRIALSNRLKAIMGIVEDATHSQNKALQEVPDSLLKMQGAGASAEDSLRKLAKTMNTLLVPALALLNAGLDKFNKLVDVAQDAKTPGGAMRQMVDIVSGGPDAPETPLGQQTMVGQLLKFSRGDFGGSGSGGMAIDVTIHNTIQSTDPEGVAREVSRKVFTEEVKNAAQRLKFQGVDDYVSP